MLFSVGTRIQLTQTGELGKVTAMLGDNMVNVQLDDDDMEIPVFIDDIIRFEGYLKPKVKANIIQLPKAEKPIPPKSPIIKSQYAILKSFGIQLAFDQNEETKSYSIYLINDTAYDVIFSFEISYLDTTPIRKNDRLPATSLMPLGVMQFDQLNDSPIVKMECWRITTQGTGKGQSKELKIKPKQFFKNILTAPLLNKPVHLYRVFEHFGDATAKQGEDLKTYTQRNSVPFKKPKNANQYDTQNVKEYASFPSELDLHLDSTQNEDKKMSNAEKLRLQLYQFEKYMEKAVRLGVKRVFIIHGVGEGRLKNSIATRLIQHPDVVSFKNEYHPRYGFGATEVIL